MDVEENLFNVSDKHVALSDIKTIVPYAEAGAGFFYSVGKSIHDWSNNSCDHTIVIKNNVEIITSFLHLSPNKLIVRGKKSVSLYLRMSGNKIFTLTKRIVCHQQKEDGLVLNNCALNTSSDLGPIAIDYSKTAIYYSDGYKVQRVLNISAPNLTTPIELDEFFGDVTAMAFNEDYSYLLTIQKRDSTQTIRMCDLASLEHVRSIQFEYPDEILQVVPLSSGLLLFRSYKDYLVLLNTYTGQFSSVNKGITYLPCDSSECGKNPMLVRDLIRDNNLQRRGEYLYGMDKTHRPIALKYNSKYSLQLTLL